MSADPLGFRFVSTNRRVREDRRFVAGHGQFVADVALEGMLHVAVRPSQHPAARIVSIDASAALAMPGVHYVLSGDELAAATDPLMNGLDTPKVRRYPLAARPTASGGDARSPRAGRRRHRKSPRQLSTIAFRDECGTSIAAGQPTGPSGARLQR